MMTRPELKAALAELNWRGNRFMPTTFNAETNIASRRLIIPQVHIDHGGQRYGLSTLGEPNPTEYHEIINRARTPNGSMARWLTYQPELCALLTREEHQQAHNTAWRNKLLRANYKRYGEHNVRRMLALVNACLYISLSSIRLPAQEAMP